MQSHILKDYGGSPSWCVIKVVSLIFTITQQVLHCYMINKTKTSSAFGCRKLITKQVERQDAYLSSL